jgi:hypothetical protein
MKVRSTKGQRDKLLECRRGVGFLVYHSGPKTTCEVEFYIHNGVPHYIANGKPIEFDVIPEVEEDEDE